MCPSPPDGGKDKAFFWTCLTSPIGHFLLSPIPSSPKQLVGTTVAPQVALLLPLERHY